MVGANHPARIHPRDLLKIEIPLPPLSKQQERVETCEERHAQIDAAREVIDTQRQELDASATALWD